MSGIIIGRRSAGGIHAITLPAIGDPFMGGYYAGIIDTTKGNIIPADYSQTGLRYALIVAPASIRSGALSYKTASSGVAAAAATRWDGLTATAAMNSSLYPAAQYCAGLTYSSDGASAWYLPAMDELELVYRNLKPVTSNNYTTAVSSTFPGGTLQQGYNPSSDPTGAAYTTTVPGQTTVTIFKTGQAQALNSPSSVRWATATRNVASGTQTYWRKDFGAAGSPGQLGDDQLIQANGVCPVRRWLLPVGM